MKERPRERLAINSFTEITQEVRLSPGRNFYDQYPFQEVFGQAAEHYTKDTHLDKDSVKSDISHAVSSILTNLHKQAVGSRMFDRDQELRRILGPMASLSGSIPASGREKYKQFGRPFVRGFIKDVFDKLEPYPDWQEYVTTRRAVGMYNFTGACSTAYEKHPQDLPPTYLEWVTTRQIISDRMDNRIMADTLADTFPQQAASSGAESGTIARATWKIAARGVSGSPMIIRRIPKTQS